jgi:hypothetical protein
MRAILEVSVDNAEIADWVADDAVCCEPVSVSGLTLTAGDATEKFAVHGKKTGNRANARG